MSWRDLWVILAHAPHDSDFTRALTECGHSHLEHLLMVQTHVGHVANWQRAASKRLKPPKLPDCLLPPDERETKTLGGSSRMSIEEANEWLGWTKPG